MSATLLCLVFSLSAVSQTPGSGDSVTPAERQKAKSDEIKPHMATPQSKAKMAAEKKKAPTEAARQRAKRLARRAASQERERVEFERNAKLRAEAREEYRRMVPYLLENQRQQLQRMTDYERNQALNRIAAANEASARAINNAAALAAANQNGFRTLSPNAAAYGPYGFGVTPEVHGTPNTPILNTANQYVPFGGVSLP